MTLPAAKGLHLFLVAGEPSGDVLGAHLIDGIQALTNGTAVFSGVGGPLMVARGLKPLFPMSDLAVMGFTEVVPRLPVTLRRLRETAAAVRQARPQALVTIDAPGFSLRLAKRLAGQGIPLIHYVAPSVWAWRPGRAKKVARFLDHLLALLPFEPPYFETVGLPCTFVGHPVIESGAGRGDGGAFRKRHSIDPGAPLLCVLPGSRSSEVEKLLPVFGDTVARLSSARPALRVVVPTVETVASRVARAVAEWPGRPVVVQGEAEKWDAFAASQAALAASGTVALELALAGLASVIAYRVSVLTAWLARRLVQVRFVSLVNIILDDEVVPEHIQEDCTPERLEQAVAALLDDAEARHRQIRRARPALEQLGLSGEAPSRRAARTILEVIEQGSR